MGLTRGVEYKPVAGILLGNNIDLLLGETQMKQARDNTVKEMRVPVTTIRNQAVISMNVVREQNLVQITLLHQINYTVNTLPIMGHVHILVLLIIGAFRSEEIQLEVNSSGS